MTPKEIARHITEVAEGKVDWTKAPCELWIEREINEYVQQQVKTVDLADVGGLLLSDLHVDYFENVECEIDGEMKDMHEYRILVEPDSEQHLMVEKMFSEQ